MPSVKVNFYGSQICIDNWYIQIMPSVTQSLYDRQKNLGKWYI